MGECAALSARGEVGVGGAGFAADAVVVVSVVGVVSVGPSVTRFPIVA
jgi:hypothetical protein